MEKLSYETALKLKEAGFPQSKCGNVFIFQKAQPEYGRKEWWKPAYVKNTEQGLPNTEWIYAPTLEELIEACLVLVEDCLHMSGTTEHGWIAVDGRDGFGINGGEGASAIEAVANLYLALNSK